jgi:hypothetical protein
MRSCAQEPCPAPSASTGTSLDPDPCNVASLCSSLRSLRLSLSPVAVREWVTKPARSDSGGLGSNLSVISTSLSVICDGVQHGSV